MQLYKLNIMTCDVTKHPVISQYSNCYTQDILDLIKL